MVEITFLIYALALPSISFDRPSIVSYHAVKSEEERLRDWIHKNNPGSEVFIHPNPQEDKLKKSGWERVPFTWRGNQIWIRRKEISDQKLRESA